MTKATIIADSKNEFGNRITTFILTFPRYLLAEVNTHRIMSRNSASSRAIRFDKMVQAVRDNPFIPTKWQKDHPGMQGTEYFTEQADIDYLIKNHLEARDFAIFRAQAANTFGLTKQICNRYLEPFMWHTCLLTGTEFENFTALRAEGMAEIHFQELAYLMLSGLNESEPTQLVAGQYHIPFGDQLPDKVLHEFSHSLGITEEQVRIRIAIVRAARISYANLQNAGSWDYEADLKLHDRLASSGHMSAFEHCAKAMSDDDYYKFLREEPDSINSEVINTSYGWCGNFRGFVQYRKMFPDENRTDSRLLKK